MKRDPAMKFLRYIYIFLYSIFIIFLYGNYFIVKCNFIQLSHGNKYIKVFSFSRISPNMGSVH